MKSSADRAWFVALGVACLVGTLLRINNVFRYPIDMGFDAAGNWEYIDLLLRSFRLPAPDEGWSTAHPPFFYGVSAAIARLVGGARDGIDKVAAVHVIRLAMAASGLAGIAAAVWLVRCVAPEAGRRAFLAGALLLFLPVHVYMSAMLSEEVLVTALISIAVVGVALDLQRPPESREGLPRAILWGVFAGLALATKLTGLLIVGAGAAAYLIGDRQSSGNLRALRRGIAFGLAASFVGGGYYLWNLVTRGYLYPHGLAVHSVMFSMPPGDRGLGDYFRIPWETFSAPELLSPALLHSVWGSTYDTIWFDGHHHFLPVRGPVVEVLGPAILVLGLVPTAAFAVGLWRGARRLARSFRGPDLVLLLLVVATFAGYVLFTWRNPWFAVLKGSFLLGLSVPFSFYASETLADWTRGRNLRSALIFGSLGVLAILVSITFSYGVFFEKHEMPGLQWVPVESS